MTLTHHVCPVWCGASPPAIADPPELYDEIRSGRYDRSEHPWEFISDRARDCLDSLLSVDIKKRATPSMALAHKWITDYDSNNPVPPGAEEEQANTTASWEDWMGGALERWVHPSNGRRDTCLDLFPSRGPADLCLPQSVCVCVCVPVTEHLHGITGTTTTAPLRRAQSSARHSHTLTTRSRAALVSRHPNRINPAVCGVVAV